MSSCGLLSAGSIARFSIDRVFGGSPGRVHAAEHAVAGHVGVFHQRHPGALHPLRHLGRREPGPLLPAGDGHLPALGVDARHHAAREAPAGLAHQVEPLHRGRAQHDPLHPQCQHLLHRLQAPQAAAQLHLGAGGGDGGAGGAGGGGGAGGTGGTGGTYGPGGTGGDAGNGGAAGAGGVGALSVAERRRRGQPGALLVTAVEEGTPAWRGGLLLGDALLSFGGVGLPALERTAFPEDGPVRWIRDGEVPHARLEALGLAYPDLVGAVEVVVTKPGYGIVSDAIGAGTRLVYTDRGDFPEYPVLVREMPRHLACVHVAADALRAAVSGVHPAHRDRADLVAAAVLAAISPPETP